MAGVLAGLSLLAPTAGSAATPGVWGVQQATYVDGTVCTTGNVTAPLAAWNFGDPGLDFLLTPVTSDGITDSAQLPQAGSPGRTTTPVVPGQYGLGSQADISAFAALINIFGTGPDPDAAEVAKAILDTSGGGGAPNCVSTAAAEGLLTEAARVAGPYTVSAIAATSPAAAGSSDSLTVHVQSTSGQGVPGVAVTLSSPTPIFAGGSGTTTVRTGATGFARVPFTVPQDNSLSAIAISASASVSVGLEAVTAGGGFGQHYATSVFADPPTAYTANVSVAVSQGAAPVLTSKLSSTAVTKGNPVALTEQLSGMFGHSGQVSFSILGPLKFNAQTLCGGYAPKAFTGAPTAAKSNLSVVGDSTVTGGNWQPATIGCYLLQSQVVTTNATPQATVNGPQLVLTVLDTVAAATPLHIVLGPGSAITESVAVTNSYHRPGALSSHVLGPLTPGSGECTTADWSKAKSTTVTATKTAGDGTYTITSGTLAKTGCYQLQSSLLLSVDTRTTARIPLTSPAVGGLFYVLSPTVTASALQTSVVSPATVRASVTVLNTYGQPGHVSLQMLQRPADEFGCRNADFASASLAGVGMAVPISGDGVVTAISGATTKLGCYAMVPKLVMDANPSVTVTGAATDDNVVLAGVGLAPPIARKPAGVGRSLVGSYITFGVFLLLLMVLSLAIFRYILHEYRNDGDEDSRPSPSGSRLGSLFS